MPRTQICTQCKQNKGASDFLRFDGGRIWDPICQICRAALETHAARVEAVLAGAKRTAAETEAALRQKMGNESRQKAMDVERERQRIAQDLRIEQERIEALRREAESKEQQIRANRNITGGDFDRLVQHLELLRSDFSDFRKELSNTAGAGFLASPVHAVSEGVVVGLFKWTMWNIPFGIGFLLLIIGLAQDSVGMAIFGVSITIIWLIVFIAACVTRD